MLKQQRHWKYRVAEGRSPLEIAKVVGRDRHPATTNSIKRYRTAFIFYTLREMFVDLRRRSEGTKHDYG